MKYYLHSSSSFSDEKIHLLFMKFGYEGLGLFYTALEKFALQEKPIRSDVLKSQLHVGKRLEKCWKFMEEIGIISSSNGESFNENLLKFSENYRIKNQKNRERVAQHRKNKAVSDSVTHYNDERNAPKDNISKVKISKDNDDDNHEEQAVVVSSEQDSFIRKLFLVFFSQTPTTYDYAKTENLLKTFGEEKVKSAFMKSRDAGHKEPRFNYILAILNNGENNGQLSNTQTKTTGLSTYNPGNGNGRTSAVPNRQYRGIKTPEEIKHDLERAYGKPKAG